MTNDYDNKDDGTIAITEKGYDVYYSNEWCECDNEDITNWIYYEDNEHPVIKKHHYRCYNCKGITQVG